MKMIPGTVSEILWHFTGGPMWRASVQRQAVKPKAPLKAYAALVGILKDMELRIGRYKEVVRVSVPAGRKGHNRRRPRGRQVVTVNSEPVCCLADIPIAHLGYHAERYGKFAIGFHRDSVLQNSFNPVFYTLHGSRIIRTIYEGLARIDPDNFALVRGLIEGLLPAQPWLDVEYSFVEDHVETAWKSIKYFLAFVKTFEPGELPTIYSEREWRSVRPYRFSNSDIAMIVLPKRAMGRPCFERFVEEELPNLPIPRSVPVIPWESLVES